MVAVALKPDVPILAFDPPSTMALSHGQNRAEFEACIVGLVGRRALLQNFRSWTEACTGFSRQQAGFTGIISTNHRRQTYYRRRLRLCSKSSSTHLRCGKCVATFMRSGGCTPFPPLLAIASDVRMTKTMTCNQPPGGVSAGEGGHAMVASCPFFPCRTLSREFNEARSI